MRSPAVLLTLLSLAVACSGFTYNVPVSPSSPWPMMRRTAENDALSEVDTTNSSDTSSPWRFKTGKGIFSSPVIGSDQSILVGSADQFFYSINPNGTKKWAFKTHEIIDSAAAVTNHGTVVVPSADGHLYSLHESDGSLDWSFRAHHAKVTGEIDIIARCDSSHSLMP